jgi:hypothetical protein
MKIIRRFATTFSVLSLLMFTGCVASVQPLSDAKTSVPDLQLLGAWEFIDDETKEATRVVVSRKKDAPNVLVAVADDGKEKETGELFLTQIGKDHFVSVENTDKDGKKQYVIAKYEITKDGLSVWGADTDFFAAAVEKKELKGTIKQGEVFRDVLLDESPEKLRKFLEKHGAKCFTNETPLTVNRVKATGDAKKLAE